MAAMTLRMSDDLKEKAIVFAKSVGVPLNALVVVALADYLALRADPGTKGSGTGTDVNTGSLAPIDRFQGTPRNALCPCGSGKKYKRCCGQEVRT
jgi:hypothetical protein